jgi:outer membrane protein
MAECGEVLSHFVVSRQLFKSIYSITIETLLYSMKFRFFHPARVSALATALTLAGVSHGYAHAPSQSTPSYTNLSTTITLADAIRRAIAENYDVRKAGNTARRNDIEVTRTEDNAWLPSASASGSWGYNYSLEPVSRRTLTILQESNAFVPTTTGDSIFVSGIVPGAATTHVITPAGSHSLRWGASAAYNIYHGGSDVASINAAQARFGASKNLFTWTRQQTAFAVTRDYLTVLDNGELVTAADSTLAEGMAQLRLVQGKYQAGVVPIGNVYQQEAIVANDSVSMIQARNNYQNARAQVLYDLNVPPNAYSNYSFVVDGIDTSTSPATRAAVDTSIAAAQLDQAINNRPDILAQENTIQATLFGVDITRGALLPSLDASAGISGAGSNTDLTKIQIVNGLNVGLTLSVPIFDQFQNELIIQEKEVDVENDRIDLENDVQTIRNQATQYVNNLKAADQALDATASELNSAEESLRLASEQLRVGAGTEVNVIIAESAVETARVNWVNAKYNWVLAQRQLAYTLGQWNY